MSKFESTVTFEDVLLRPQYSDIVSRKEIDTSSKISEHLAFHMPIISSPMDTVTEAPMASKMADLGGLGIIHRYCSIEQQGSMVEQASSDRKIIGAAIGITGDYFERAKYLVDHSGAKVLCIDVAHGHHSMMKTALETLRTEFNDYVCIIAGNVATLQGFNDLSDWGADSIRVGIGGGSVEAQINWRGHTSSVEGVSHVVPYKGPVERTISELCRGIRSGLSYSGCRSITEFQSRARFVRQTAAGQFESSTHIKSRF